MHNYTDITNSSDMKRLVFFIGGLNFGGMERVAFIAGDLLKSEYDITFVTLYQNDADYKLDNTCYDIGVPPSDTKLGKIIGFCRRYIGTIKMKKRLSPDIVYSFGMYSNYLNALTKGTEKIVMGIRSYDWLTNPFVSAKADRFVVHKFDKINSVSKKIAEDACKIWRLPTNSVNVIYNPYDVEKIQALSQESVDDFNFEKGCYYYLSIGRLADQKGFNHLIRAFHEVSKGDQFARLIIMGNGDRKHDLINMINQYKLNNVIFLIEGKSNPYKYMRCADVYVLSSHTEGFPNALVEAMSIGKLVVSVNCKSGPSEILINESDFDLNGKDYICTNYGILCQELKYDTSYDKRTISAEEKSLSSALIHAKLTGFNSSNNNEEAITRAKSFSYSEFKDRMLCELAELDSRDTK